MTIAKELKTIVGSADILMTAEEMAYARLDQSTNVAASLPLLVVKVRTVDMLIAVVQCCIKNNQPMVVRAAGSGKSGGAVANGDAVLIDISLLNRILKIDDKDLVAIVEPGVVLHELQMAVDRLGLFYPPDPASFRIATIGGNVAENAAGPSTLKYGSTRDYLLGGQAILGTGELIDFGKRCPKGVAGYDVASLLCGSEGTLAIFTKLILRLLPKPRCQSAAIFFFDDQDDALAAVNAIFGDGHLPRTLEYVDAHCLKALGKVTDSAEFKTAAAALIIECDSTYQGGSNFAMAAIGETLRQYSVIDTLVAKSDRERKKIWDVRSMLSDACSRFLGHKISEDIAVPLGSLSLFQRAIARFERPPHLLCGLFGHAGDGNLHVQIMFDDQKLRPIAEEVRHEVLLLVLKIGGTLTAEHGIGLQKKEYLPLEQSGELIELQRRIKKSFDPHNLLNPGKIFDV